MKLQARISIMTEKKGEFRVFTETSLNRLHEPPNIFLTLADLSDRLRRHLEDPDTPT